MSVDVLRTQKKRNNHRRSSGRGSLNVTDKATLRVIAPYVNIVRKGQKATLKPVEDNKYFTFYLQKKPSVLKRNLKQFIDDDVDLPSLLNETVDALKTACHASCGRLYLVDLSSNEIYLSSKHDWQRRRRIAWKIEKGKSVAAHVALTKRYVIVEDVLAHPHFSDGIPYAEPTVKSVLCVPIVTQDDECYAVIELYRELKDPPFQNAELLICNAVAGWMGASILMNLQQSSLQRAGRLNDCLIELTRCYMADTVLFDKMITEIVSFAKSTVNAERASFFVIDTEHDELVGDVFDEDTQGNKGYMNKRTNIRFGKERGIAGYVARTGLSVNIKDAFRDPRFCKDFEDRGGFITRSILCMPVVGIEGVLGVVQAVNKKDGPCFTSVDEIAFKTFSVYCAMALNFYRSVKRHKKDTNLSDIATGLIRRHLLPCDHEILQLLNNRVFAGNIESIREFTWYIPLNHLEQMPQIALYMLMDIGGNDFNMEEVAKFVLTLKNFYRKNPYHNWEHGFTVCNCMYNILIRNKDIFTRLEQMALILAALGHDVDHGGVTNQFLYFRNDPLSQLYDESPWENHHYVITMLALNEIHVFSDISADDFKAVATIIKDAIIATDLARYFRMRGKLIVVQETNMFDFDNPEHRYMLQSVMMNACDLSGQCKPYPIAKYVTDKVYEEFYIQGDWEKAIGKVPLSLMDREQPDMVAMDQLQFLNVLVLPICDLVRKSLPNTDLLYKLAERLRNIWAEMVNIQSHRCWRQEKSIIPEKLKNKGDKYYYVFLF